MIFNPFTSRATFEFPFACCFMYYNFYSAGRSGSALVIPLC